MLARGQCAPFGSGGLRLKGGFCNVFLGEGGVGPESDSLVLRR